MAQITTGEQEGFGRTSISRCAADLIQICRIRVSTLGAFDKQDLLVVVK
jgi:hypothetical protein